MKSEKSKVILDEYTFISSTEYVRHEGEGLQAVNAPKILHRLRPCIFTAKVRVRALSACRSGKT